MRIVVALSGGVDSAVAAARLVRDGADVVAVHYRTGATGADAEAPGAKRSCCGVDDARDARAVAAHLGLPFYVVDVSAEFSARVIDAFIAAHAAGTTPNPCIACNQDVKFGKILDLARGYEAEAVATGHYARTAPRADGGTRLLRGVDDRKDQSYVLYGLSQAQLASARFPLGASTKEQVRAEARALGLPVADKPDSQELCFVPGGDHRAVLEERAPGLLRQGDVLDLEGNTIGRHGGAAGFTIGQRKGIGVAAKEALYVAEVDTVGDRIRVGPRESLLRRTVVVGDMRWIDESPPPAGTSSTFEVEARIRHGQRPVKARLRATGPTDAVVEFDDPVFAPAPGQALVAYRGDAVLGGGTIRHTRAPGSGAEAAPRA